MRISDWSSDVCSSDPFGTRFIYDDVDSVLRWTAGDMLTRGEGFQASLPLAGLSVQRSYGLLQPYQSVRPTGRQSFFLRRPSTVEVMVNGDRKSTRLHSSHQCASRLPSSS